MGMGSPHSMQEPNSGSCRLERALLSLPAFCRAAARVASLTLRVPMASMRESRPMALSGAIGLVSSVSRMISLSVLAIASIIRRFMSLLVWASIIWEYNVQCQVGFFYQLSWLYMRETDCCGDLKLRSLVKKE